MAIANSDGSIILSTKVDTSEVDKLGKVYEKALKKGNTQLATLVENFKKATQEVETQKKKVEKLKKELSELESGKIQVSSPETEKIRKEIESTTQAISEQEKQIEQFYSRLDQLQSDAFIDPRTGNPVLVGADKKEFEQINAELDKLEPSLEANRAKAEQLKNELNSAIGAATQGRIGATKDKLEEAELKLTDLSAKADISGAKLKSAMTKASVGLKSFTKRIAGIIKSALIFSVIYRVMQSVVKLLGNILMSNEDFKQDWEELKAAFYTAAYPIVNLIVPAIKYIVQQVRDWSVSVGKVAAALQGMSYSELVDQAKASKEAADNYADMEKSSKKTADNVKKQLAAFDDINILSSGDDEEKKTGLEAFQDIKKYDTSGEKTMLGDIMGAIGGALMAVGLILLFHGQIAWGIGFIIAGAIGIAAATLTDESVSQKAKDELSNALLIVGVVAIVIGILLCMAQQWGIGIGLIVLGVTSIVAPIALNWDGIKQQLQTSFGGWLFLGGLIAIALGILLCFTPFLSLGIGLIVLGAGAVVAPIVANWDAIIEALRGPIGAITAIVSGALLVLGIILVCTGVIPLGIGLIIAGAAGLVTVVAVNWNTIVETIKGFINSVIEWIKTYGLLVLGIILCLTGVGIPFGIALIIKWVKDGSEAGVPLANKIKEKVEEVWNAVKEWIMTYGMLVLGILLCLTGVGIPFGIAIIMKWAKDNQEEVPLAAAITEKVKEVWNAVKKFWNENIAPIFTLEWWKELGKKCINGLIAGFEGGINGIINAFESMINWVVGGLNKLSFSLPEWAGGYTFGINIPKVDFAEVKIPRLAQGAVIPPNREFLAVLGDQKQGTNIEAPLKTIVDAFNIALSQNSGVGSKNTEIVLEVNGREFGRAVVELGNEENRRVGTRLVIA